MEEWRLIADGASDGATNMAVDECLAARFDGTPVLRTYGWKPATVSLGYSQAASSIIDPEKVRRTGFGLVRRPTGGRAVLHDDEVTYCLVFSISDPRFGSVAMSQHAIGEALARALASLGAEAELSPGRRRGDGASPCFASPSRREVTILGRKVVGSAQRRYEGVALQHGSILLSSGQSRLCDLGPLARAAASDVGLREVVGDAASFDSVSAAVARGFEGAFGVVVARSELTEGEKSLARRLREGRYATDGWTFRR